MKRRNLRILGVVLAGCAAAALAPRAPRADEPKPTKNPVVVLDTSMGLIRIELDGEKAPITVKNFVSYVSSGHFNGTIFHRVIPNFMIQGGGFTPSMAEKKTGDPIKNEAANGLKNERGT